MENSNEQRTTSFKKLDIYKEKGKVVISKQSPFKGVVFLTPKEVRVVASVLYKMVKEND